jgi:hypothetical protein
MQTKQNSREPIFLMAFMIILRAKLCLSTLMFLFLRVLSPIKIMQGNVQLRAERQVLLALSKVFCRTSRRSGVSMPVSIVDAGTVAVYTSVSLGTSEGDEASFSWWAMLCEINVIDPVPATPSGYDDCLRVNGQDV